MIKINARWNMWLFLLCLLTALLFIPIAVIVVKVLPPYPHIWSHIVSTVLADYIFNSLVLVFGVALGTLAIGCSTAWLTSMCHFPGRHVVEWALLLPMAMPAYIIAYTYTGMLDVSGPLQTWLREVFSWRYGDYWFPEIRSLGGAILMFSLVLYPYVYLIVRSTFLQQSRALLEVSRSLGKGPWQTLFHLALPSARPAIIAGVTLVLMETLADYGTVHYFGISTFTTGIFRTWFGFGELRVAAQLAAMLLGFVALLIIVERFSRRQMRFNHTSRSIRPLSRMPLKPLNAYMSLACCVLPILFGFILPSIQLVIWLGQTWQSTVDKAFLILLGHSFFLASLAALSCVCLATLLCFCHRLCRHRIIAQILFRMASMGYALPGTVIAIGVLITLASLDNGIDTWLQTHFGWRTGLLLSGSVFALIFAYTVRFVPVAMHSLESGYAKISFNLDDSSRTLGRKPTSLLALIHLPLLRSSLLAATILVFVDVLKELPATLILRPFDFNTLAVRAYELASDERLADASAASLAIVLVGLLPLIYLSNAMNRNSH